MRDTLVKSVQNVYTTFIDGVLSCVDILTKDVATAFPFLTATMTNVETLIKSLGLCLLSVFFMFELVTMLQKLDGARYEDAIKILFKLAIARIILDWTPDFLGGLYWKISTITDSIASVDASSTTELINAIKTEIDTAFPKGSGIVKTISQLGVYVTFLPNFILMFISYVAVYAMAYGRMIEIVILTYLSAIPMSFIPFSKTEDIPKRYLLNYGAVCLQGLVMIVCFKVYLGMLVTGNGDVMHMTVMTVVLLLSVAKSSGWAKAVVGIA